MASKPKLAVAVESAVLSGIPKSRSNRRPWQRMALSLLGIVIVAIMWRWATLHLYALPQAALAAFTSITNNSFYVIGAIVIFMVTGKLIYDWKSRSSGPPGS